MPRSLGINYHHYYNRGNHTCVPLQGGVRALYKQLFLPKNTILNLVLEWPTKLPPSLGLNPVR